jgi:squalene-associated FAD-dependent desaturase
MPGTEGKDATPAPVAIIGGGWAGCAAAVTLAQAGVAVALFESGPVLGGRARRVTRAGLPLDNGQHLLLGAYQDTLSLMNLVHGAEGARATMTRTRLAIVPLARGPAGALALDCGRAPGRLGLLLGLLSARGLTFGERWANVAWFRNLQRTGFVRKPEETVAQMLAPLPRRVAEGLWEPLCLAALNTPPSSASAQVFANVLEAALAGPAAASDFLLPATDLSAMFPEIAGRFVEDHGGVVRTSAAARILRAATGDTNLLAGGVLHAAGAVIVAVGPHQLGSAFAPEALSAKPELRSFLQQMAALAYEPIITVWLGYESAVPLPAAITRLDDQPGQWIVDRPDVLAHAQDDPGRPPLRQLLAVILSAGGPHEKLDHPALVRAIDAQLQRLQPARPRCTWSQVIAEKRATYACTPRRMRPGGVRLVPGVYLAGDYVDARYPATLEAAMRSGIAAANAVLQDSRDAPRP